MKIRPLNQADLIQARQLWEACFHDHPAFLDWYFQTRFQPEDGLGIFQGQRLLCDLHLAPRQIKIRNKIYPSAYLIALATDPAFRRLGLAKNLLTYALRHLAAHRRFFTFLLPFDTMFYTRLGWGIYADHRLYLLPKGTFSAHSLSKALHGHDQSDLDFYKNDADQKLLEGIYHRAMESRDGALVRTEQDWTGLLLDLHLEHGRTWLAATNPKADPQGYAMVLPPSPATHGRPLLRELAYLKPHQTMGLAQLAPYIPPGTCAQFLGRITNVRSALEALPYPLLTAELVMEIIDPLLPENSGLYLLNLTKGRMHVSRTMGLKPAVHCTISALAALATGSCSPQELVNTGEIALDGDLLPILDALFPPTTNFINEYF